MMRMRGNKEQRKEAKKKKKERRERRKRTREEIKMKGWKGSKARGRGSGRELPGGCSKPTLSIVLTVGRAECNSTSLILH